MKANEQEGSSLVRTDLISSRLVASVRAVSSEIGIRHQVMVDDQEQWY